MTAARNQTSRLSTFKFLSFMVADSPPNGLENDPPRRAPPRPHLEPNALANSSDRKGGDYVQKHVGAYGHRPMRH